MGIEKEPKREKRLMEPEGESAAKSVLNAQGVFETILVGDVKKPGLFIYRYKWPPHFKFRAHIHSTIRYVVVISGTHYYGIGEKFDEHKLRANPPGTFFIEPPNAPHFGASKDEEVVLQICGIGPSDTTFIEPPL